jgi:hypothetical protein
MGTSYRIFSHLGVYNDCRNDLVCEHQCYQEQCYLPIVVPQVLLLLCTKFNKNKSEQSYTSPAEHEIQKHMIFDILILRFLM